MKRIFWIGARALLLMLGAMLASLLAGLLLVSAAAGWITETGDHHPSGARAHAPLTGV